MVLSSGKIITTFYLDVHSPEVIVLDNLKNGNLGLRRAKLKLAKASFVLCNFWLIFIYIFYINIILQQRFINLKKNDNIYIYNIY